MTQHIGAQDYIKPNTKQNKTKRSPLAYKIYSISININANTNLDINYSLSEIFSTFSK